MGTKMSQVKGLPKKLEERLGVLTERLVPDSGPAETLEGELLRAINRILYRFYNDGDYWYKGYGTETAGPAAAFLMGISPVDVSQELKQSDESEDHRYELWLAQAARKIVKYIESRKGQYTANTYDMLDFEPLYDQEDEDDDYD